MSIVQHSKMNQFESDLLMFISLFIMFISVTSLSVNRYRETVWPIVLLFTASGMLRKQSPVWIGAVYFGLVLLGGVVLFTRSA